MARATVRLDPAFTVGPVARRIFGSFVEHMGRCVYTGIFEPDHPDGGRARASAATWPTLVRELGVTMVRYPGGNFVSNYRWEDGVGPTGDRPTPPRPGLALARDQPGRHRRVHRLGSQRRRRADDGRQPRHPRRRRGRRPAASTATAGRAPRWPTCAPRTGAPSRTTSGCGASATRWTAPGRSATRPPRSTRAARGRDGAGHAPGRPRRSSWSPAASPTGACRPSASGSATSSSGASTSSTTSRPHAYYEPVDGDVDSFLACAEDMDRFIDAVVATADHVAAVKGSDKRINISFDEWNVWYQERFDGEPSLADPRGAPSSSRTSTTSPTRSSSAAC